MISTQFPETVVAQDSPLRPLRLIALAPAMLLDPAGFSQLIYHMAFQQKREVLYLTLADQEGGLLAGDRMLAELKSLTDDPRIKVRTLTLAAANWVEAVRFVYQPGDVVVCHDEQKVRNGWRGKCGLGEYLDTQLNMKVHLLDGFIRGEEESISPFWPILLFWASFLATLVFFTFLEIRMEALLTGGIKTLMLVVLVCVEFSIFFKLNNMNS